jgi:hypothetical protein
VSFFQRDPTVSVTAQHRHDWEKDIVLQRSLTARMKDLEMLQSTTQSREKVKKPKLRTSSQR